MNINNKNDGFSCGFTTASGSSINVSQKALSKAKKLFNDELAANEETCRSESKTSAFQTARGQHINVTDNAMLKANALLREEILENLENEDLFAEHNENDVCETQLPNVGFQTASGQCVNITNKALLKAKVLFQKAISEESENEDLFAEHKENDARETQLLNIGFQTANGQCVNISNKALLKAKALFQNEISEESENEDLFAEHKENDARETQLPNLGFRTASGLCINVTNKALLKAKALFQEQISEMSKEKYSFIEFNEVDSCVKTHKCENKADAFKMQMPNVGFQTASGQHVNVTNEALSKAKVLFQEDISENSESIPIIAKPLQKRKLTDVDDHISLNRPTKCNQFKKLRFSNEFQIPKPIHKNLTSTEEKENQSTSEITRRVSILSCDIDKFGNNIKRIELNKNNNEIADNSLISNEILASAVALLADEIDTNFSEQWKSPKDIKDTEETGNIPSSPVIGGQFIPKKRKSTGGKKKSIGATKSKENKSVISDNPNKVKDRSTYLAQHINKESECLIEKQELIDNGKKCNSSVANDFGDTQLMLDFINHSATILEKRLEAALDQDKQINLKQKYRLKPTISKLYFRRKSNINNRVSWKEISKGYKPVPCTYEELVKRKLPPEIMDITANNAITYKFRCADFYGQDVVQNNIDGIKMEEGGYLILDENDYAGLTEIKRSFLASPGVDPNLLPTGWVENHYKWIVWKLASLDRIKLGSVILPRTLTPNRVMMELKYRYDREIDRSQRPALRKILEKDDVSTKRMVLCVSSISERDDATNVSNSPNQLKMSSRQLVLTDGWYSIQASVDQAMIKNITSGKIKEGTKLVIYGSELLNCDQGYPPLEVPENVCLKLHTNSTRRARWDLKLGYTIPSGPLCIKLKTICPNGGLVGKIKVTIARVYPMLYHEKNSTGESIFRNTRCEEKANIAYEKECRLLIEAFYAKAERYFYTGKTKSNSNPDSIDLAAIEWNEDCEKLSKEEFLSKQEIDQLKNDCRMKEEKFRQKLESRLQESLPPPRQVTPLLKIRVIEEDTNAILSVWSPGEEVIDMLKEGNYISVCNVMPSAKRSNELQLTASRTSLFSRINVFNINFSERTCTALCDINKPTFAPVYGEFDTVGIVAFIGTEPYGMKNFQAACLACPNTNSQSSYLSILFWNGISSYGYAEILTVGSLVACSNLEWRRATSWNIPMSYCTERSTFTRNPRQNHLQQPFGHLKQSVKDVSTYVNTCSIEISEEIQKKSMTRMSDQYTPDKSNSDAIMSNENYNPNKYSNHASQEQPRGSLLNNHPAKSVAIQKRLEKLQCYGEASSLSPIVLNSSNRVSLDYQSPLRSRNEKQNSKAHTSLNSKFTQNSR